MWKLARAGAANLRQKRFFSAAIPGPCIVHKRGADILHDPWFNKVLKAMQESDSPRPAIFAMSNPTMNAECTAADAFKYAGENIVFASGSPFENVVLGNEKIGHANQANNMYLFPGIGLGALLSGAHVISDGMLQAAAERLASYMTDEEIQKGILFPSISSIRHITMEIGAAVVQAAVTDELAGHGDVGPKELRHMSKLRFSCPADQATKKAKLDFQLLDLHATKLDAELWPSGK